MARILCDSCDKIIEKPVYCCDTCRVKAWRSVTPALHNRESIDTEALHNDTQSLQDVTEAYQDDTDDDTPALPVTCLICQSTRTRLIEDTYYKCNSCKQSFNTEPVIEQ